MANLKVTFANDWFAPTGDYYRVRDNPHMVSEGLRNALPKSAKVEVIPDAPAAKPVEPKPKG